MASRASRIAYVLPGDSASRWQAAPTPDRPAPTISTSTCCESTRRKYPCCGLRSAQGVVVEAHDAPLVLARPGVDSAHVAGLGDLPERLRRVRGLVEAAVQLLAVIAVRRRDQHHRARRDA